MEVIKYRAWDKINKKWLNVFKLALSTDGQVMSVETIDGEAYGMHQVDLVQFTGLRDRDGREIWERDIVSQEERGREHIFIVIWDTYQFSLKAISNNPNAEEWKPLPFHNAWPIHTEKKKYMFSVIGNIYNNPGLVK